MRSDEDRAIFARARSPIVLLTTSIFFLTTNIVSAQDPENEVEEDIAILAADAADVVNDEDVREEVVVTGSRLKRDTYTSIAPLQIISGQLSREVGLMDAGDILQESTAAAGTQIDLTFNGFVLDNGPGQTNINLRGLGGARTLVLINGRRVAPAGVEGAPTSPDLGLVPSSLVQQYDLLLDGASSIYGSDAVAGVANIIMRKDFNGLELEAFTSVPQHSGGVQNTLSVTWGKNFDRGFVGIGAEHTDTDRVTLDQRPWTARCDRNAEIDENGNVRSLELRQPIVNQMPWDDCKAPTDSFTIFQGTDAGGNTFSEALFYTPGTTNTGVPNWSDWAEFAIVDLNNDGIADVNFRDYTAAEKNQDADLFGERKTTSAMAYGEYTFEGEANITPFFEVQYGRRQFNNKTRSFGLFPAVPANNPFNPCNPNTANGVDCALGQNELLTNPDFLDDFVLADQPFGAQFGATYGDLCAAFGLSPCTPETIGALGVLGLNGPFGAIGSPQHIVYVRGDRDNVDVDLDQIRAVVGVSGDLPWLSFGSVENWSFEVAGVYSESTGTSARAGIREDRLDHALGFNSIAGATPCQNDTGTALPFGAENGCVPVNLFAPSLLDPFITGSGSVNGEFATQAERDYLFDSRDFETTYEQKIATAYVTGDVFELPGGTAAFGLGFEHRIDDLKSLPDENAANGLSFGFSSDLGAIGQKDTTEFFAEIELPLIAGIPGFEELTLNLSTRHTDDEIYGGAWTESFKLGWRPIDSLLIRGTYGTSFRAPNLRELFLAGQTGFNNTFFDPCYVPLIAINDQDEYVAANDPREPQVLANCLANGVDPTVANQNGIVTYPVEIASGGSLDLFAEESESWTAGLVYEFPTNAFDLTIGGSYYEIEITQSIIEPSANFIVGDCYGSLTGNSAFCDRITRDFSDPVDPRITLIDSGFLNRDSEKARGVDLNLLFTDTITIAERPIGITVDVRANRQLERSTLFVNTEGVRDFNEFRGSFGFPPWKGRAIARFDYSDWRVSWEMNYLGSMDQRPQFVEDFDALTAQASTCLGPPTDVLCRDIGFAENYFRHGVSLFYLGDYWQVGGGIRNVFEEEPPFVDGGEVLAINNAPIGVGYDLGGRTYFLNASYNFGGNQ